MENILEKIFESVPKARILKLFMRNTETGFTLEEITSRSQLKVKAAASELKKFLKLGILRKKKVLLRFEIKKKSRNRRILPKTVIKTKKCWVYEVNPDFTTLPELKTLVTKSSVTSRKKLSRQIKSLGKVKLAVISGIFLNNDMSRTDLLIVGDKVKKSRLDTFLAGVESEIGRSIRYTLMDSAEFKYRLDMYDRFLRDILEHPHEKLINKAHI